MAAVFDWAKYLPNIEEIIDAGANKIPDILPAQWACDNIVMGQPFPGPMSYEKTRYTEEIVNTLSPAHPLRTGAVMGSAQWGKTAGIIIPGIGWIINNDPGPIIMTVGHDDLLETSMAKVDYMLDCTGTRRLIKPSAQRTKNQKTGDTNNTKEFPQGFFKLSAASNFKIWREVSYKYGFIDDFEAVKGSSKQAGSIRSLIEKRFNAFDKTRKLYYISSPELAQDSNILEVYLKGDQRKYLLPCPCCGSFIELIFETKTQSGEPAGITWQLDDNGRLIERSVCYTCQECGGKISENGNEILPDGERFERNKIEWVNLGFWKPTAIPFSPDYFSWHMSCLYSPPGMAGWISCVYKYLDANPPSGRIENKWQTFLNIELGLPYEGVTESSVTAQELQMNIRNYPVNIVPDSLSVKDGNGHIVLLTLAADCNGHEHDARIDWEVKAWSESTSCYSVIHGSIGTFILKKDDKKPDERIKWSYQHGQPNCVWPELEKILNTNFKKDSGGAMRIAFSAVDSGKFATHIYAFQARTNFNVICIKGDNEDKYLNASKDKALFHPGSERAGLFILEVGRIKDRVSENMKLVNTGSIQPPGFMNYPQPSDGLYSYKDFFKHYEAEHCVSIINKSGSKEFRWMKKKSNPPNHFWDVHIYNFVLREIAIKLLAKNMKDPTFDWEKFCQLILKS